jgi:hypothetical protein
MKILFFFTAFLVAIFSISCTNQTKQVSSKNECTDMPFQVNLPSGWSCKKTVYYYAIQFDNGLTGEITVSNIVSNETISEIRADSYTDYDGKVEGLSLLCKDIEKNTYCKVLLTKTGAVYSMILTNKNMPQARLEEAEKIIKSVSMN